ncbi:ABC transporter permease [uncultured Clostridium sp.]|uniref:ABC transporter permease n=1 Tax=uncultured Clostridium sp. TaxID=59620 RepID=UPI002617733B|nr:ABC transporter permease [uncultured Clostridium sp.]
MNFIKRAFLSSKSRLGKTSILLAVMLTVCVVILASFGIKSAAEKSSVLARQKLGADVTLTLDVQKMRGNMMSGAGGGNRKITEMPITLDYLEELKEIEYVESYLVTTVTTVNSDSILAIGTEEIDESSGMRGPIRGDLNLTGVNNLEASTEYMNGDVELIDGRGIVDTDTGDIVAIEETLANENNLKVGDKFIVESPTDITVSQELEIVGIYRNSGEFSSDAFMNVSSSPFNKMFVPYNLVSGLKGEEYTDSVGKMVFYLDDPINVDKFIVEAEKTSVDLDTFMFDADTMAYETMMGPIDNVASFSSTALIIVTIFGAVILALIIMLSIKDRTNEIGILLSLGESKFKIIGQFLVEVILVLVISLSIAGVIGRSVSNVVGAKLLNNEIQVTSEMEESSLGSRPGMGGPGADAQAIDELNIEITADEFTKMGILASLVAIISTIIPAGFIMRLHPKTILSKHN